MRFNFATLVSLILAIFSVATGCLFFTDRSFYWAGELIGTTVQHALGAGFAFVGLLVAGLTARAQRSH